MSVFVLAFLIGVVAGLRSMTAPMAVSWAARLGWLGLESTPLAFLASAVTAYILTGLAFLELLADKLPKTPSRKAPVGFIARLVTGAVCGAAFGLSRDSAITGVIAGVLGAIAGTLGGYAGRMRLAKAFGGADLPAAVLEDSIAVLGAFILCRAMRV